MSRVLVAAIASLLVAGILAPAVAAAPASDRRRPCRGSWSSSARPAAPRTGIARRRAPRRPSPASTPPDVTELYSPARDLAGGQEGAPGRQPRDLHGPRQRLARASTATASTRRPRTASGSTRPPAPATRPTSTSVRRGSPRDIELAKNAVVLLNHLCYASGNTEPGLPEGTLDQARQRVDNFAAGFIAAGASRGRRRGPRQPQPHGPHGPGRQRGRLESAWRRPRPLTATSSGSRASAESGLRRPDGSRPRRPRVHPLDRAQGRARLRGRPRGARGRAAGPVVQVDPASLVPSLVGTGLTLQTPALSATTAGATVWYRIPYTIARTETGRWPAGEHPLGRARSGRRHRRS